MQFKKELIPGRLIRRYKRFLADIELKDGTIVTAHCTNTGSMATSLEIGAPVMLSEHDNPLRKTRYTWELIFINNNWVGVNTMNANILAYEFLKNNSKKKFTGFTTLQKEVKVLNSRIDLVANFNSKLAYFEVKNVSMKDGESAIFPDTVTHRGKKHLETLMQLKKEGHQAAMIYIIQRKDISCFKPAFAIDPQYAKTLNKAWKQGVDIIPIRTTPAPEGISIDQELPFDLGV